MKTIRIKYKTRYSDPCDIVCQLAYMNDELLIIKRHGTNKEYIIKRKNISYIKEVIKLSELKNK